MLGFRAHNLLENVPRIAFPLQSLGKQHEIILIPSGFTNNGQLTSCDYIKQSRAVNYYE